MKIKFASWNCYPRFRKYGADSSTALELVDAENSSLVAIATVCLLSSGYKPPADCIAVKDWSENAGMVEALVHAGLIEPQPLAHIATGFVHARIHRLTPYAQALRGDL